MPYSYRSVGEVLVSLSEATEPAGGHGRCDARLPSQLQSTVTAGRPVFISYLAHGRNLSWPEWLVTYQDGMGTVTHLSTDRAGRIE